MEGTNPATRPDSLYPDVTKPEEVEFVPKYTPSYLNPTQTARRASNSSSGEGWSYLEVDTPGNNEHTYDNRDSAYSTPDPTQDGDPLYQDPTELQDEQEKEEIRAELLKTEEEIKTLKQVLASKERAAADLKRRLGITPLKEFKDEASKTWKNVQSSQAYQKTNEKFVEWKEKMESSETYQKNKEKLSEWNEKVKTSETYKKTSETLSVAGQKTAQASAAAWQSMSRKLGEMKNSQSFKSFEEKVGSTVSNLKTNAIGSKVTSPREPKPTFEDVLNSTANADKQDDSQNAPPLPEEKVPL